MDLLAGRVFYKCLPSLNCIRAPRTPPLVTFRSPASATLPKWRCPPPVRGNAPLVMAFSAKKNKGSSAQKSDGDAMDDSLSDDDVYEEEEEEEEEDDVFMDDEDDDEGDDDDDELENDFGSKEEDLYAGDGGAGGGISLAGTWWDKEALALAEEVSASFDSDLKIYAFKAAANLTIRVRIEKLSTKYGSPTIGDIEAFTIAYRAKLDEAGSAGRVPENTSLEVSSPGAERVVRVPEELERFKERAMYVRYVTADDAGTSFKESDGVFSLISFDMELGECTWGVADVKVNRKQAGKGRPLSKKQREWRLQTPFESLKLVRLYSDC